MTNLDIQLLRLHPLSPRTRPPQLQDHQEQAKTPKETTNLMNDTASAAYSLDHGVDQLADQLVDHF